MGRFIGILTNIQRLSCYKDVYTAHRWTLLMQSPTSQKNDWLSFCLGLAKVAISNNRTVLTGWRYEGRIPVCTPGGSTVVIRWGRYIHVSCVSGCCAVYSTCHFRRGEVYILFVWLLCCCAVYSACRFRRGEVYVLCVWLWCCLHLDGGSTVVIRWGMYMSWVSRCGACNCTCILVKVQAVL